MAEGILTNVNQDNLKASLRFLDKPGELTVETLKANGKDVSKLEKLDVLLKNEDFAKELAPTTSIAEAQAVFSAHGLELSREEVKEISQQCAGCIKKLEENDGELSESDLEQICGGASIAGNMVYGALGGAFGGGFLACVLTPIFPGIGTFVGYMAGSLIGAAVGSGIGTVVSFFQGLFD